MEKQYLFLVIATLETVLAGTASSKYDYKITDSSLETPNYPSAYPTNIRLSYDIPIPAGKKLVLTFVDYELQDYCGGDNVIILDDKGALLGDKIFCGLDKPGPFVIEGTFATVGFKSGNSGGGSGFRAEWVYRVNGNFTEWSNWTQCDASCSQVRTRSCTNPPPQNGGLECVGHTNETRSCKIDWLCPVDDGFSQWSNWTECNATCSQVRTRFCTNPPPQNGGLNCNGHTNETRSCKIDWLCPEDGNWTAWGSWSFHSDSCNKRSFIRVRNCTSPHKGARECDGNRTELKHCHYGDCSEPDHCCLVQEVKTDNFPGNSISQPITFTKSTSFTVFGLVGDFCPVANGTLLEWRIRDLDSVDDTGVIVSSGDSDWTIQKQSLPIGFYLIEFRATLLNATNVTSRDYTYVKIKASPLVARIVGGSFLQQRYDKIITLDASQSYDPDTAIGNYTDMGFTWLCKKSNETYPPHTILPTNNLSVIYMADSKSQGLGGCFGTGIGRLNSTEHVVKLNASLLGVAESYDFTLTVTKGNRYSSFLQTMKIVKGDPLPLEIRCFANCDAKMNPSARLRLTTFCNGTCDQSVSYHWTLYEISAWDKGKAVTKPVDYLLESTLTEWGYDTLAIKENSLRLNQSYLMSVRVEVYGYVETIAMYDFSTNSPPTGGWCKVDPPSGDVLVTSYKFKCHEWTDDDLPLMYKIYYKMDESYILGSHGRTHYYLISLPQGTSAGNYEIQTRVDIVDSLGALSSVSLNVKVSPPKQTPQLKDTLRELTIGKTSKLSSMASVGDVDSTTQLANSVLSCLEHVEPTVEMTREDKIEIKDAIIVTMATIKPKTLDAVSQVTSVLKKATEQLEEVSLASQRAITELVESMTAVLVNENKTSIETLVSNGGEGLVTTVGNNMNAAARGAKLAYEKTLSTHSSGLQKTTTEAQIVQQNAERAWTKIWNVAKEVKGRAAQTNETGDQSQTIVATSIGQVSKIGSTLLSRKIVGEPATVIKTKSLSMLLGRQRPTALNGSKIEEGNVSFALPPVDELLHMHNESVTFLDSQMLTVPFNPYTWDKTADKVRSYVVSLQLKDNKGSAVTVDNLKSKIHIAIPRRANNKSDTWEGDKFFIKPSKEGKMQHHVVNVDLDGSSMKIKINMKPGVQFTVYVKFKNRPTVDSYDYRTTVPDFSSCVQVSEGQYTGCQRDPHTIFLSSNNIEQAGTYYIGIQYKRDSNDTTPARKKRSCFGSTRQKRSCAETKEAPSLPVQTIQLNKSAVLVYDPNTDQNYTMAMWQSSCLYWSVKGQNWTTQGCEAIPESTEKTIHCLCNHLTAFGGVFFVPPNPIDFDKVLVEISHLDHTGNIVVLSTIIVLLSLYLVVVVIAKRADNSDQDKIGPPLSINPDSGEAYQYEVTVNTGVWRNSGTTANVSMVMHGSEATSAPIVLHRNIAQGGIILARGSTDKLYVNLPQCLGTIKQLQVSHDNSGLNPSWFLSSVIIRDIEEDQSTRFMCNRWFALEREDGKIVRSVFPTSEKTLKSFKSKFESRISKNYADNHLWLSVITKTPRSTFTRVQRTTCCLTLLFSVMIANAMFYQLNEVVDQRIQVGPLKFSPRQVAIGVQSCLMVAPVNLFIVWLFRNSRPLTKCQNPKQKEKKVKTQEAGMVDLSSITLQETRNKHDLQNGLQESQTSVSKRKDIDQSLATCQSENIDSKSTIYIAALDLNSSPSEHSDGKETRVRLQNHEDSKELDSRTLEYDRFVTGHKLPFWCGWIAWFLCFAIVVTSATFTFFYSLMWGKEIANQWLSSMFVSFVQELFFNQPIKMFAVMVVLAWILKKPSKEITAGWTKPVKGQSIFNESNIKSEVKIVIPDEEELERSREYRTKNRKMFQVGRELITYIVFLFLLMTVCYGNRTEYGFLMTQDIKNTFSGMDERGGPSQFFQWMGETFVPGVYAGSWYNGDDERLQEYIGNKRSLLVGMPRLRQLRVKEGSCDVPEKTKKVVTSCYDFYSFREEDTTPVSLPGWFQFTDIPQAVASADACPKPWRYEAQEDLKGIPLWGYFTIYDGGGYVADLGYNSTTAINVMENLTVNSWIDRKSRVVVLEFSIFNANTNYISICTFFYEILPTGYRKSFQKIETIALYHTDSVIFEIWLVCQFFFMALVFYYLSLQIYKMCKQKCHYFKQLWNWIDLAQIITALLALGFYMIKATTILDAVLKLQKNPFKNVNFHIALQWVEAENLVLSFAVFIGTTKLLRLIRFNFEINIMTSSIRISKGALISYVVVLLCIVLAFAQTGYLVFGATVLRYSTFTRTLVSEMEMALGGATDLDELRNTNRILGPVFAFSYMTVMAFILVNIFIAILDDSYHDVKENPQLVSKDHEIGLFMKDRLVNSLFKMLHRGRGKSKTQETPSCEEDHFCNSSVKSSNLLQEHSSANIPNERTLFSVQKKEDSLSNQLQLLEYLVDTLGETVAELCISELPETYNS